jgi:hypothetical protein
MTKQKLESSPATQTETRRNRLARVAKVDMRRGVATAYVISTGKNLKLTWEIVKHAPTLAPGQEIWISLDGEGDPEAVRLAD